MNLHHDTESFKDLIELTTRMFNIPSASIRKDYFITYILANLSHSRYCSDVVFKGGTSLSKCYPKSIERFSEDLDLTYIPDEGMSDKQISKKLKGIEKVLIQNGKFEKINDERNDRNKSCLVWFHDDYRNDEIVKLEIGSSVRPHPYSKKTLKSYIQEYLENIEEYEAVKEFELHEIELNVLNIERTFIDKLMSVKRHAICGTLSGKVRHIYDITKLIEIEEIKNLLSKKSDLKSIVKLTKETDSLYLSKRNIPKEYNPTGDYDFQSWEYYFSAEVKTNYELLHTNLLYSNNKQDWDEVFKIFTKIDNILKDINE